MTSLLGVIPLLAIGMNFYRYQSLDPEGKVKEPSVVSVMLDSNSCGAETGR